MSDELHKVRRELRKAHWKSWQHACDEILDKAKRLDASDHPWDFAQKYNDLVEHAEKMKAFAISTIENIDSEP